MRGSERVSRRLRVVYQGEELGGYVGKQKRQATDNWMREERRPMLDEHIYIHLTTIRPLPTPAWFHSDSVSPQGPDKVA
jgi:hypothetical protein